MAELSEPGFARQRAVPSPPVTLRGINRVTNERKHSRYSVCSGRKLHACFQAADDSPSRQGVVVDISVNGARIALPQPATVGDEFEIELQAPGSQFREQRRVRVCWSALRRDFLWHAGVEFDAPLTDESLDELASGGVIERRQSNRTKVSIPASARQESSTTEHEVRIADLSVEGFGFTSSEPLEVGNRVLVSIAHEPEPLVVIAHVRACNRKRKNYAVGCEFVDTDSYRHLRQFLPARRPPKKPTVWSVLRDYAFDAAATFLCVAVVAHWGLSSSAVEMKSNGEQLRTAFAEQQQRV